jgi:rubrerythrin
MDIFEFAIRMESDGQAFYLELAKKAVNQGVRNILTMLAADEEKHQATIEQMREGIAVMADSEILTNAKNVFQQMKEFGHDFDVNNDAETLYRQAMEAEQKSLSFYLDRADQAEDPTHRELFKAMAAEEKMHYHLLGSILDFVSHPKTWLDDAEFTNLEEY